MDLSIHVLEGLTLCGDGINVPDKAFQTLYNYAFNAMLDVTHSHNETIENLPGVDQSVAKQCFFALSTVILEASRKNVEESEVSSLLEECKWPKDRFDVFIKQWKLNKKELQQTLCRIHSTYPHIVDVDWRLDYCIKSNQLEKLNESKYMVSLKTQEPGSEGSLDFFCSVDQLQDLVTKLKDATKTLEKASQT